MKYFKKYWEEFAAVITIGGLTITNLGDYIVNYTNHTLSWWDILSAILTVAFVALMIHFTNKGNKS